MKKLLKFCYTIMFITTLINLYGFFVYIMHEILTWNKYQTPGNVKTFLSFSASIAILSIFLLALVEKQIKKSQLKTN